MWRSRGFWFRVIAGVLVAALGVALWIGLEALPVLTGYKAKVLASGIFVARRSFDSVHEEDLDPLSKHLPWHINQEQRSVHVSLYGLGHRVAHFHPDLGATLLPEGQAMPAFGAEVDLEPIPSADLNAPWPIGDDTTRREMEPGRRAALDGAVDWAFQEYAPARSWNTRAVIVAQGGNVLAERYGRGIGLNTPLLGWSMTKSVVNAMVGILVHKGQLDIHQPAPVPAWAESGDPRRAITIEQLLQMSSGLTFDENYTDPFGNVLPMLFREPDMAAYAASLPLRAEPGSLWSYSSGSTNLICRILRDRLGGEAITYFDFPRKELFGRLGMTSAVMEADASGTFVGSSYMYATARDWARFGQLYLQDGVWKGERILPEGWVTYSTTPAPKAPRGRYGAHWWLNAGEPDDPADRPFPTLPADLYYASGHEGQFVVVIPSRDAVIVRLGVTRDRAFDLGQFVGQILAALPEKAAPAP